ncbi:MAG: helical backbone metal receptor [Fimbriimonadales bacterium]|nr:helical backbone metal receptor [Fimbriimonadales bacterium]MCS7191173.1 helical backbone metal receptor [Fimbriimonadales bacterium]
MPAQRIVSLAPSITEILFALGLGARVVGVTEVCDYPPEAKQKPKVGDYQISPERVVALKPDLVVAHAVLNSRVLPVLKRLGLRVLSANPNQFSKLYAFMRAIGQATGAEREAERIIRGMQARVAQVRRVQPRRQPRTLFLISVEPIWASGRDTLVHEMITLAGGHNLMANAFSNYKAVSLEAALGGAPELVLLAGPKAQAILRDPRWGRTPAVRRRHVYELNADLVLRETPRSVQGLEQIAQYVRRAGT